ncbi:hypothetical protein DSLASN_01760 [Desulfoluna limicola]|uniref:HNH nuclease domain-containing protein n=1 Tax=Desulfoluna limicola TaxID=2810562 RepID=A0ABM7PA97_9BACT|nr:HNH endonuclease [Desulfoluna limicola]BCS94544.1 hypothetical protein DSLASN_01760 [Desulfoluna limicola]
MAKSNPLKKCRRCGEHKPKNIFVDISGNLNPRGAYCSDCHLIRVEEWKQAAIEERESKLRKLRIIYGEWWRHYCLPKEFADEIYNERDFCPYCGDKLPPQYIGADASTSLFRGRAHLDHMDPLNKGGEDSIRNVVYVCDNCNYKKGKRTFIDWLQTLKPKYRAISREIYETKHGHPPESFEQGEPNGRCDGSSFELCMDEEDLRELYPTPIVNGPPVNKSITITASFSIDDNGNIKVDTKVTNSKGDERTH